MQNPELVAKLEQCLNDVSAALHRLTRERDVLRETKSQFMMGVSSADQAEADLSRLPQRRDSDTDRLTPDIVTRLRHAGL